MNSNNNIDLGFEAHQRGDYQLALNFYEQALLLSPSDAEALSLKGSVLSQLNRVAEAEESLKKAVEIEPEASGFWLNLADHFVRNSKIAEGCQLIVNNVSPDCKDKQVWQFLYQAGLKSESSDFPVLGLQRLLGLEFDFNVLISLSQFLVRAERFDEAIEILKRHETQSNRQTSYWHALCWLLNSQRRWSELQASAQVWLRNFQENKDAFRYLATASFETGLYHNAIALYEHKLLLDDSLYQQTSLENTAKDDLVNFIDICVAALELKKAQSTLSKAIALNIKSPNIINAQVQLAIFRGDIDAAKTLCFECIVQFPEYYPIYIQLARVSPGEISTEQVARIVEYTSLHKPDSDSLAFVLGHYFQANNDSESAWEWYCTANSLRETRNAERGVSYVQPDAVKFEEAVMELDNRVRGLALNIDAEPAEEQPFTPVFILGMPRSGSTLLEGLLSQHSAVCKTGERIEFPNFLYNLTDSTASEDKLRTELCEFRRYYIENSIKENAGLACFIDKNPSNYLSVGLIKSVFPSAVIINIKRTAIETIWSIYRHEFSQLWSYATSVENTAHQYAIYERLMRHWEERYQDIISVEYEYLVEEPNKIVTMIMDKLGLDYTGILNNSTADSKLLINQEFTTLSAVQVRGEIKNLNGQAQTYKPYLTPLLHNYPQYLN